MGSNHQCSQIKIPDECDTVVNVITYLDLGSIINAVRYDNDTRLIKQDRKSQKYKHLTISVPFEFVGILKVGRSCKPRFAQHTSHAYDWQEEYLLAKLGHDLISPAKSNDRTRNSPSPKRGIRDLPFTTVLMFESRLERLLAD